MASHYHEDLALAPAVNPTSRSERSNSSGHQQVVEVPVLEEVEGVASSITPATFSVNARNESNRLSHQDESKEEEEADHHHDDHTNNTMMMVEAHDVEEELHVASNKPPIVSGQPLTASEERLLSTQRKKYLIIGGGILVLFAVFVLLIFLFAVNPKSKPSGVPLTAPGQQEGQTIVSSLPTLAPTLDPTLAPTSDPTLAPTSDPTLAPTSDPTLAPTLDPTQAPTSDPTLAPTSDPTQAPTLDPTLAPTLDPTTVSPSVSPSQVLLPSFLPTTTRLDRWIDFLIPFSGQEALTNVTSPQYQAALWLANDDELQIEIGDTRGTQRYFLATFYFALDGDDNWVQCGRRDPICGGDPDERTWLLDVEHECDWLGVGCDITRTVVTSIFFPRQLGNGLRGYLPPELVELTALQSLILQRNELYGTIPAFLGKCKELTALFLLGNQFVGTIPSELLTGATMLGTIHFGANFLTGTIPSSMANLPLRTLNLADNLLTGSIPNEFVQLTMMTHLDLWKNRITGPIPEQIYEMTSLTRIRLYQNKLQGTLSSKLGQLSALEDFRVGNNDIVGSIPESFYQMARIIDFRAENAQITGSLSNAIGGLKESLRRIILGDNKMGGPMPIAGIEMCTNMNSVELHGNSFTGTISRSICESKGGRFFDLQNLTVSPAVDCSIELDCCNLQQ